MEKRFSIDGSAFTFTVSQINEASTLQAGEREKLEALEVNESCRIFVCGKLACGLKKFTRKE